jgi:hypothetical protein
LALDLEKMVERVKLGGNGRGTKRHSSRTHTSGRRAGDSSLSGQGESKDSSLLLRTEYRSWHSLESPGNTTAEGEAIDVSV